MIWIAVLNPVFQVHILLVHSPHLGVKSTVINVTKDGIPVRDIMMKLFVTDIKYSPGQYVEGFRIIKTMGEGRYGICYLITDDKSFYVLKQLKKKVYQKNPLKAHYEEEILKVLEHVAIPRFIRKIEDGYLTGYILEYKQGVTMEALIFDQIHIFTRSEIYDVGKQLIDILKYLHGKGIVHRDIRIPNTLYNNNRIFLVDFGLARWIDNKRYTADIDFSYLGDLLIHLYYTSFAHRPKISKPWYEELVLSSGELLFLKRLMGIEPRYQNIEEVEINFEDIFSDIR